MIWLAALGAWLCEWSAPRLAGFGFVSAASLFYFILALDGPGPGPTALVLLLGLALRGARRPSPLWRWELAAEAVPALAMLALLQWLPAAPVWRGLAALQLYLGVQALVPTWVAPKLDPERRQTWSEARLGTFMLNLGSGSAGVLAALAAAQQPAYLLWAFPLALVLQHASISHGRQSEALLRLQLDRKLQRTQDSLESSRQTVTELHQRLETLRVLHEFGTRLTRAEHPRQAWEALLQVAAPLLEAQSLVVFDQQLCPRLFQSPHRQLLEGWELAGRSESAVQEAWRQSRAVSQPSSALGGEVVLAVPLERFGVFYVGSAQALVPAQHELACVLAGQTAAALRSLHQLEELRQSAAREAALNTHLQNWLSHLSGLLECLPALTGTLELGAQRQRLDSILERLVPHQRRRIYLGDWPEAGTPEHELVERLRSTADPLLIDELQGGKLASLGGCLLAFGLRADQEMLGAVLLASDQPRAFQREHQQLMALFAFQTGLALHNADLHRQSLEAYSKLQESQAQLVWSSKLAAVGQLAAGMAHELNTPLATVRMSVELAALEASPKTQKNLDLAVRQVQRAQSLIEKVLYYSRDARAGRQPVQLTEVVEDTLQLVNSDLKGQQITLQRDLQSVPRVVANANELQQVVLNLLLNARDALAGVEQPSIRLSTSQEQGSVCLSVEDNGSGIPTEVLERIFDPFFTTKEPGRGTGLGLSISREIVEKHGGQLSVENAAVGVRARLLLPIQAEQGALV